MVELFFFFFLFWQGETVTPTQGEGTPACLSADFGPWFTTSAAVWWLLATRHPAASHETLPAWEWLKPCQAEGARMLLAPLAPILLPCHVGICCQPSFPGISKVGGPWGALSHLWVLRLYYGWVAWKMCWGCCWKYSLSYSVRWVARAAVGAPRQKQVTGDAGRGPGRPALAREIRQPQKGHLWDVGSCTVREAWPLQLTPGFSWVFLLLSVWKADGKTCFFCFSLGSKLRGWPSSLPCTAMGWSHH